MTPVAVAGMHRTGSSMIANLLWAAGLHLGDDGEFVPAAPDNPEGFFEHASFVSLNDDLLEATGGAWDHPPACGPMGVDDARVAHLRGPATELAARLALVPAWGWKDPRTSLTARFWLELLADLKVVITVRHPLEVALSLKRRNLSSYAHALSLWHTYYEAVLDAVPDDRRLLTHYDAYFADPAAELARTTAFVGLPATDEANVVRSELRHHRVLAALVDAGIAPDTVKLYRRLCDEARWVDDRIESSARPAHVDRDILDRETANQQLAQRSRQVASLERARAELEDRVAELEAVGRDEVLGEITARLDVLENTFHDLRYLGVDLRGRGDAAVIDSCRSLVRVHVPRHDEVLVVAKGDEALLDLYGRRAINFPANQAGDYPGFPFNHSIAAIAHLEARRLQGSRWFLLPETAGWWSDHFPGFIGHLLEHYVVAADEPGTGLLVDLRARRTHGHTEPCSLMDAVARLAARLGREPSVLDWTGLGLSTQVPGRNVFTPPAGDTLPYLDSTVDAVVIADADRRADAKRVAVDQVLTVTMGHRPTVAAVEELLCAPDAAAVPVRVVVNRDDPDPTWLAQLEEAVADEPSVEVVVGAPRAGSLAGDSGVVALVEEGVVPLPGCCATAGATLASSAAGAVVVKLFRADGALDGAGGFVFGDGSWAGVAAGSHQVVAPWHEYVREVPGGLGLVFFDAGALAKVEGSLAPLAHPIAWTAPLWAAGLRVLYQPDALAVRARPRPGAERAAQAIVANAWADVLSQRPPRPDVLDERAWSQLLARDDIEAPWR